MSALATADLDALRNAMGDDACDLRSAREVEGVKMQATLTPADPEALARAVRVLAERSIGCVIQGGATRMALGNAPRGARVLLSTTRLDGVAELDAEEGVARVLAGTPLATLRADVEAAGWELPFDAPGARTTLGGVLATGAVGPRHAGFGRPRDLVLGLDVVLGDGLATRCGGRVVKNVTGYDVMKLHIGACGAFGVITSAWLRLRPRPESVQLLAAVLPDAGARALAAARLPSIRAAMLVDACIAPVIDARCAPASGWLALFELAGDEAAVALDAARLVSELGAEPAAAGALARARVLQGETFGASGLRFRLAVLPSELPAVVSELHRADAALLIHPSSGLVYARLSLDAAVDAAALDRSWLAIRRAARAGSGHAVLEAAPGWTKALGDVFGAPREEWRIARALKTRFDPASVLNPGRYVGGI